MVYQAMFDEVDEGTAIFKCTDDPPVGDSKFFTYEGLPSDFYLRLDGNAARMIRGETPLTEQIPQITSATIREKFRYRFSINSRDSCVEK